jgi:hypothetical protein
MPDMPDIPPIPDIPPMPDMPSMLCAAVPALARATPTSAETAAFLNLVKV